MKLLVVSSAFTNTFSTNQIKSTRKAIAFNRGKLPYQHLCLMWSQFGHVTPPQIEENETLEVHRVLDDWFTDH